MSKNNVSVFENIALAVSFVKNAKQVGERDALQLKKILKNVDEKFLKTRHVVKDVEYMVRRFEDGDLKKACLHANKVAAKTVRYANDTPFNVNDDVSVIRTEHGWISGEMLAKIVSRHQSNTGVWSYSANVYKEDRKTLEPDYIIYIDHTRDACLA